MRVFVIHDSRGNIRSFAVPAPAVRDQIRFEPPRGQFVSTIDLPDLDRTGAQDLRQRVRQVSEALKDQKVERGREQTILVPRQAGKPGKRRSAKRNH